MYVVVWCDEVEVFSWNVSREARLHEDRRLIAAAAGEHVRVN